MKRWIVPVLLILATVLLLSPGIIGLITERQVETHLQQAGDGGAALPVTEHFERRWFASEGIHRVPLQNPELRDLIGLLAPDLPPLQAEATLLIETEMRHGLLPAGSYMPALATGRSRLFIDSGGERTAVPGEVLSRLGLNGGLTLRYPLPPGQREIDGKPAVIGDGELVATSTADGNAVSLELSLGDASVTDAGERVTADTATLRIGGASTSFGFPVGSASVMAGNVAWQSPDGSLALESLAIAADTTIDGDRIAAALTTDLSRLLIDDGAYAVTLKSSLDGFRADIVASILRRLQQGTVWGNDGTLHPFLDNDLRALLSAGGRFSISNLNVDTPEGPLSGALDLSLPEQSSARAWAGVLLSAVGTAELRLPRAVASRTGTEIVQQLLAAGFLIPDGDNFKMDLQLDSGRLTVNGAPLPLGQLLGSAP